MNILAGYVLTPAETVLLHSAAHSGNLAAGLATVVDRDGILAPDGTVQPAAVEPRQQRLVLGRLLAALRLPDDATGQRAQHRSGPRASTPVKESS